jgi:hypothetical protein
VVRLSKQAPGGDTTAPTVAVVAPTGGAEVEGRVAFRAEASDDEGVVSVRFEVNDQPVGTVQAPPWELVFDAVGSATGSTSWWRCPATPPATKATVCR